jgi:hypothetical protein
MTTTITSYLSTTENLMKKIDQKSFDAKKMRKQIINYTNNFREFKGIKANLINELFEYETNLNQANDIIKHLYENNEIYVEIFADLKSKHEENIEKINFLTNENNIFKEEINLLIKEKDNKNDFNNEKDYFIKDLIGKIKYLENILKEYQKRYYIPKYTNVLEYKFNNSDKFKDTYKNLKTFEEREDNDIAKMRYTTNTKISNINSNNNSIFKSNLNEDIKNKNKNNNDTFSKRNKSANLIRSKKN